MFDFKNDLFRNIFNLYKLSPKLDARKLDARKPDARKPEARCPKARSPKARSPLPKKTSLFKGILC
ncbi:MAG: hypothetical protein EAY66_05955 [Sphingobacteriales bacterium]|nr:MAG: hypothetical protein EAY66_05955 [Sphingobacteriales bacterium]